MDYVIGAGIGLLVAVTLDCVAQGVAAWRVLRRSPKAEWCEFCGPGAACCGVCGRGIVA